MTGARRRDAVRITTIWLRSLTEDAAKHDAGRLRRDEIAENGA